MEVASPALRRVDPDRLAAGERLKLNGRVKRKRQRTRLRETLRGADGAVPKRCACRECVEQARMLEDLQAWQRFEKLELPLNERLRRWALWAGSSSQKTLWTLYVECVTTILENGFSQPRTTPEVTHDAGVETGAPSGRLAVTCRGGHSDADPADAAALKAAGVHACLTAIGLSDREIAVLSRLREGHSQRQTAALCGVSPAWVFELKESAARKLSEIGVSMDSLIPPHPVAADAPDLIPTDPELLDQRAARC
jgi:hypothetical protein